MAGQMSGERFLARKRVNEMVLKIWESFPEGSDEVEMLLALTTVQNSILNTRLTLENP